MIPLNIQVRSPARRPPWNPEIHRNSNTKLASNPRFVRLILAPVTRMETKEPSPFKMQTDNERMNVFAIVQVIFFNQNSSEIRFDLLNGLVIIVGDQRTLWLDCQWVTDRYWRQPKHRPVADSIRKGFSQESSSFKPKWALLRKASFLSNHHTSPPHHLPEFVGTLNTWEKLHEC